MDRGCADAGILCEFLSYAKRQDFMPFMSLYLKRKFYAKLVIKYLMESFYTTAIGAKCIMSSPIGGIHKGKILQ